MLSTNPARTAYAESLLIDRRQRDFLKLWGGQTISEVGSRITRDGLPYTAVLVLGATPGQMGVLAAISGASVLLFSLAAGVVVDRVRRRPVMIAADLGRAAILATIPLAAKLGALSMGQLLGVAAVAGVLTVLFDVSYQSYVPALVGNDDLLEANRRLTISSSTAEVLGPALTGILVKLITAPLAILLDAISFVFSAISVWAIRMPEPQPKPVPGVSFREEVLGGGRAIAAHAVLRLLCLRSVTAFFSMGLFFSLYFLYAIRVLRFSTAELGVIVSLGGAGSLFGAMLIRPLARRFHSTALFLATGLITSGMNFLIPLAASFPKLGAACMGAAQFFGDGAFSIYLVNETTLRQQVTHSQILGRVNAVMQLASRGMLPLGALAGGFLADRIGVTPTLWIGASGLLASCLWLIPVARMRIAVQEQPAAI